MKRARPFEEFVARQWGSHRERGNIVAHALGLALATTGIVLLLARIHVTIPGTVPLAGGAVLSLGWAFAAALVLAYAPLDLLTAVLAGGILALTTGAFHGEMYGEWATGTASWLIPLLGFAPAALLVTAGHRVYHDVQHQHLRPRPGVRVAQALSTALLGFPAFVLFLLLGAGFRPALRARIEEQSRRSFVPRADRPWRNWAGTAECTPAVTWYPRTPADLVEIVALARREKRRIRVVGASYSWAPLVPTNHYLVCLCLMNEVALDLSDPARPRAAVGAGANGRDLNRALEPQGYAVTSNVVMETVSWGGMIGVGAHGSGWDEQTLSDQVEVIELVDGTGTLRRFEVGADPEEIMRAVRVSLGLFGIVHRITIRVVPAFNVRHEDRFMRMDGLLERLPALLVEHEYLDLYWMPFNDDVWVRIWNRTGEPRTKRLPQGPWSGLSDRSHWGLWMSWLQTMALRPLDWLSRVVPAWTPAVCRMKMALARPRVRVVHINEATHFRSAIESYRLGCAEFAFAIDPEFQSVKRGWNAIVREIEAWAARGRYPLTMVVNARFVRGSDCLLSPAHGNERTCYLEILGDHRGPDWVPFVNAVTATWMELPNARTHWGKEYDFIPGIAAHTRAVLGEDLQRFLKVREALGVDPDGIFLNPLIERLFLAELDPSETTHENAPSAGPGARGAI